MNATETKIKPVDALGLWDKEAASAASQIELIRVDGNEKMLIPFTCDIVPVDVHYLDYPSCQGYHRCNGKDCVLCRIGRKKERRDLWPAYDVVNRQVGVLPISPSTRQNSLRPQVAPIIRSLAVDDERCIILIRQDDRKYFVGTAPLSEEVDDGAEIVQRFQQDFEAGKIDLASVYTQQANAELAEIPEISTAMKVKGVKLS